MFCGSTAENASRTVLRAREVELPIMAYGDGHCGRYNDGMVRSGMLCAGYSDGNRDTCQVGNTAHDNNGSYFLSKQINNKINTLMACVHCV